MALGNPLLRSAVNGASTAGESASYNGIGFKLGMSFLALLVPFAYTWRGALLGNAAVMPDAMIGLVAGLILGLVIIFANCANAFTVPLYAACQGLALGAISAAAEVRFPHIAMKTALLTMVAFGVVYVLFTTGILRATQRFARFMMVAVSTIAVVYLVDIVARFFGHSLPYLNDSSGIGIAISAGVVVIAALTLVTDFAMAQQAVEERISSSVEWRIVFSLLVSLVWLYVEILRLLTKIGNRR